LSHSAILWVMSKRSQLTPEEKQNGKRTILTPLPSTLAQAKFQPTTLERFSAIVKKAIPPSPPRPKEAK
jgi:hypothetical protein